MIARRILFLALLTTAAVLAACGKDDTPLQPAPPTDTAPTVSGVSSTVLVWGDTLVVSGSKFRTPANTDTVTFSDPASATPAFAATPTSLSVIVPATALSGPITVSHAGGSATGPAVTVAPPPPVVTGVSAATVSPGDMITITGSDFLSPPDANQVLFTNPLGGVIPFDGTATTLSVVVPQDATTGPVAVTHAGGTAGGPSVRVQRGIGDFFVFGGLGASQKLALPNPTSTTRYLIIPHATNPNRPYNEELGYDIETEAAIPVADANALPGTGVDAMGPQEIFEAWRWEQARELFAKSGVPHRPAVRSTDASAGPQATRQFYVLKTTTGSVTNPSSYQNVSADLRYSGTKCLVYADQDTLATGNLATSDLRAIGEAFDNSIDATNVQYFGTYSDIDGNGRVIILVTPVVNRLTAGGTGGFIAGFFLSVDLYAPPAVPTGTTNQGELFYLLAADPAGNWGVSHSVAATRDGNISTTAHEHEHMISFSYRLFNENGVFQQTWLEEGMAHMAEDLNGLHDANMGRTAIYLANPGVQSLEDNTATLAQRGGVYLFLRLMADRYGTGILKQIVQSTCNGRFCVQNVTGEDFYDLIAEFLAALYLSGNGITADPRFNYTSINLADYGTLGIANRLAGGGLVAGDIRRSTGDFYLFSGSLGTESRFTFNDQIGGGLRNAIVRVQ